MYGTFFNNNVIANPTLNTTISNINTAINEYIPISHNALYINLNFSIKKSDKRYIPNVHPPIILTTEATLSFRVILENMPNIQILCKTIGKNSLLS